MNNNEPITLSKQARCLSNTAKALRILAPDFQSEPFWVPISCIHDDSEVYEAGHTGKLAVPYWFAYKQGWV